MKELMVKGTKEFLGMEIPVIEGGFGKDQKVILAKTIAEIHGMKLFKVNELINNNIEEFENGVDILDLKTSEHFAILAKDNGIYTQNALNSSKNIYLLSEQGYMLLVGFMKTEKAKKIRKQLRREYFAMREIINSNEQLKAMALLKALEGATTEERLQGIGQYTEFKVQEATTPLLEKIEEDKPMVDFANTISASSNSVDVGIFAKLVKDENIPLGRNKLFDWLRANKYLMKNNVPYQTYIDNGYFEIVEYTYNTPYGSKLGTKTLVTGKGQIKLVEKLRKEFSK